MSQRPSRSTKPPAAYSPPPPSSRKAGAPKKGSSKAAVGEASGSKKSKSTPTLPAAAFDASSQPRRIASDKVSKKTSKKQAKDAAAVPGGNDKPAAKDKGKAKSSQPAPASRIEDTFEDIMPVYGAEDGSMGGEGWLGPVGEAWLLEKQYDLVYSMTSPSRADWETGWGRPIQSPHCSPAHLYPALVEPLGYHRYPGLEVIDKPIPPLRLPKQAAICYDGGCRTQEGKAVETNQGQHCGECFRAFLYRFQTVECENAAAADHPTIFYDINRVSGLPSACMFCNAPSQLCKAIFTVRQYKLPELALQNFRNCTAPSPPQTYDAYCSRTPILPVPGSKAIPTASGLRCSAPEASGSAGRSSALTPPPASSGADNSGRRSQDWGGRTPRPDYEWDQVAPQSQSGGRTPSHMRSPIAGTKRPASSSASGRADPKRARVDTVDDADDDGVGGLDARRRVHAINTASDAGLAHPPTPSTAPARPPHGSAPAPSSDRPPPASRPPAPAAVRDPPCPPASATAPSASPPGVSGPSASGSAPSSVPAPTTARLSASAPSIATAPASLRQPAPAPTSSVQAVPIPSRPSASIPLDPWFRRTRLESPPPIVRPKVPDTMLGWPGKDVDLGYEEVAIRSQHRDNAWWHGRVGYWWAEFQREYHPYHENATLEYPGPIRSRLQHQYDWEFQDCQCSHSRGYPTLLVPLGYTQFPDYSDDQEIYRLPRPIRAPTCYNQDDKGMGAHCGLKHPTFLYRFGRRGQVDCSRAVKAGYPTVFHMVDSHTGYPLDCYYCWSYQLECPAVSAARLFVLPERNDPLEHLQSDIFRPNVHHDFGYGFRPLRPDPEVPVLTPVAGLYSHLDHLAAIASASSPVNTAVVVPMALPSSAGSSSGTSTKDARCPQQDDSAAVTRRAGSVGQSTLTTGSSTAPGAADASATILRPVTPLSPINLSDFLPAGHTLISMPTPVSQTDLAAPRTPPGDEPGHAQSRLPAHHSEPGVIPLTTSINRSRPVHMPARDDQRQAAMLPFAAQIASLQEVLSVSLASIAAGVDGECVNNAESLANAEKWVAYYKGRVASLDRVRAEAQTRETALEERLDEATSSNEWLSARIHTMVEPAIYDALAVECQRLRGWLAQTSGYRLDADMETTGWRVRAEHAEAAELATRTALAKAENEVAYYRLSRDRADKQSARQASLNKDQATEIARLEDCGDRLRASEQASQQTIQGLRAAVEALKRARDRSDRLSGDRFTELADVHATRDGAQ